MYELRPKTFKIERENIESCQFYVSKKSKVITVYLAIRG